MAAVVYPPGGWGQLCHTPTPPPRGTGTVSVPPPQDAGDGVGDAVARDGDVTRRGRGLHGSHGDGDEVGTPGGTWGPWGGGGRDLGGVGDTGGEVRDVPPWGQGGSRHSRAHGCSGDGEGGGPGGTQGSGTLGGDIQGWVGARRGLGVPPCPLMSPRVPPSLCSGSPSPSGAMKPRGTGGGVKGRGRG